MTFSDAGAGLDGVLPPAQTSRAQIARGWRGLLPLRRPQHVSPRVVERQRGKRHGLLAVLIPLVAILGFGGYVALRTFHAVSALQSMAAIVPELEQQLLVDPTGAPESLVAVQEAAHTASRATSGSLFNFATHLPVLGDDLRALAIMSATAERLTGEVFPRMYAALTDVDPQGEGFRMFAKNFSPLNGYFDLNPLLAAQDDVVAADAALTDSLATVRAIEREGLMAQVSAATDQLQGLLSQVSVIIGVAARTTELVPPLLGSEGPRTWLILFTNNAEIRPLSGVAEAILEVTVDHGRIEVLQSLPTAGLPGLDTVVGGVSVAEVALFGEGFGRYLQDVTATPDFPRAAELTRALWVELGLGLSGQVPEGVIAIDVYALQAIVGVTSPVGFFNPIGHMIEITADNIAPFLLFDRYTTHPEPDIQALAFSYTARAIFEQLMLVGFNGTQVIGQMDLAATEGRLMVWSAIPAEQAMLSNALLSGTVRGVSTDINGVASPVVGVYLTQQNVSNLGYYLDFFTHITYAQEMPEGRQDFTVQVELHNRLTPELLAEFPSAVRGAADDDATMPLRLYVVAPLGGSFGQVTSATGHGVEASTQTLNGLPLLVLDVDVLAQGAAVFEFQMESGPDQPGAVQLRTTPSNR